MYLVVKIQCIDVNINIHNVCTSMYFDGKVYLKV